ncbi:MAG: ATP-dependent zinc metalloprotease FtsH [Anaerolineae bacterium]|nr:ATP-dependent zinc metalloprotease FtsH [Anaerolineae bacterium]
MKEKEQADKLQRENRRRQWIFSLIYMVVSIGIWLGVQWLLFPPLEPEVRLYSEFLAALESGQVNSVLIRDKDILWFTTVNGQEQVFTVQRLPNMDDSQLLERLQAAGVEFAGLQPQEPGFLMTLLSWVAPVIVLVLAWRFLINRLPGQHQALMFGSNRARVWDQGSVDVTFDQVAGADEAVAELREIVDFLKSPERYQRLGGRVPKGVLLVGPPGTGKTLLARAVAGEARVPFFSLTGSDFIEIFVGVGAARVRDLFKQAREKAPCIIFIDEIDAIGRARGGQQSPVTHEEREQTLNQLLSEMDGFDSRSGVIIMAATNRPEVLDPALLRPGRFDRQIVVDKPDRKGRRAILEVHTRNIVLDERVDLDVIAARTPGFAGAELENLVNEAALLAARRGANKVEMIDFENAADRVMMGLERQNRALSDRERRIVACHEMGHALVASLLPSADPVHRVSIVPRGVAALGVTMQLPAEDRYLLSEAELHDRIAVLLGGRAAEAVIFGQASTGAADDLQRVSDLARRMVSEFGMSKQVGPFAVVRREAGAFLPGFGEQALTGPDVQRVVDQEVKRIVEENYARALRILETNRHVLETLAQELLETEDMDGAYLQQRLKELGATLPEQATASQPEAA